MPQVAHLGTQVECCHILIPTVHEWSHENAGIGSEWTVIVCAEQANRIVLTLGNRQQLMYSPLKPKSNLPIAIDISLFKISSLLTHHSLFSYFLFMYFIFCLEISPERKCIAFIQLMLNFCRTLWNKYFVYSKIWKTQHSLFIELMSINRKRINLK